MGYFYQRNLFTYSYMNKNLIIGAIIVVILILLGFWYVSSLTPATPAPVTSTTATSTTTNVPTTTTPATVATKSAFKSIFTQSGNHECTYQQVGGSTQGTSVIYISNGKMRGEFRTTGGTVSSANLMIYNGGYLYSWVEGTTVGKKTSINSLADLPAVIPQDLTSGAVFGTSADSVGWDCHDWLTDNSIFVIPTYVKFTT